MCKRLIFLCLVVGFCLTPAVQAAKIIFVSDRYDEKVDGVPDDAGWVDFLTAQGYTVDYKAGPANGNGCWRRFSTESVLAWDHRSAIMDSV